MKRGVLGTTIAPLAAILMMTAAVSAIATGATDVGVTCDERSFAPDDATLRGGRAVGAGRIRVLGGTALIVPGQALLLGVSRRGYVCALFANGPDTCVVNLTLVGEFLFVDDNRMCGGHNVAFSGIFIRRPEHPK